MTPTEKMATDAPAFTPETLPDPNHPAYEAARQRMAQHLRQIGEAEPRSRHTEMADDLLAGDLMQVPTWLALGLIAQASRNAAPDLLAAADKLMTTFDELRATTVAERIMTGRSDRELRLRSEEAMTELRAALAKALGK